MEKYVINKNTMYLKKEGNNLIIREDNKLLNINSNILKVLDNSCILYGSSYKGRRDYVNTMLNYKYKNPIYINDDLIFFLIGNFRSNEFILINVDKVLVINKNINNIVIKLINDIEINIDISINSLYNLIIKCILLKNIINNSK